MPRRNGRLPPAGLPVDSPISLPRAQSTSDERQRTPAVVAVRQERWFAAPVGGQSSGMRVGNVEIRPLGGGLGCLLMVLFSIVASVVLTVLVNLLLR
jgi:hypothetical protein